MRGLLLLPHRSLRKSLSPGGFRACLNIFGGCLLLSLLAGCGTTNSTLALPKSGGPIPVSMKRETTAAEQAFWDQIAPAQVLYIPETHNNNTDHEYQFDVMKGLKSRGVEFVIGWEMFDVTQQSLLDQWNGHQITTETLLEKTDWQRHWGVQSVLYEKMMRWSLGEGVTSLALNAPQSLSHKMASGGEFTPEERALLPGGFRPLPGGFEHFAEQMNQNPHAGAAASLQNFYKAQLVWEQTMASRVLDFLESHPNAKLVVLLGRGHVDGGFGVPAFVRQKTSAAQLVLYPGRAPAERRPAASRGTIAGQRLPAANRKLLSDSRLADNFTSFSRRSADSALIDALVRPN